MADSKYNTAANGYSHSSNDTKTSSIQRNRYSNPNAALPPNSTIPSFRSHLLHKTAATPQISQMGTGNVSYWF